MTKTKFMIEGANVSIVKFNEATALDYLPPQIYTVQYSEQFGFFLSITKEQLQVPEKIYGNTFERVNKCIVTYKERTASTGILLTGDKGTGKTLLMSLLANTVITNLKLPVILIKDAHAGEQFTSFIESIGECCVVFDEFGKMYKASNHEDGTNQNALLSLMDGVDKTKRLLIMTENSELDINEFMINRPSRIYYHFKYKKLDEKSIDEYCADFNIPSNITKDIIDLSRRIRIFSFDILQSIVEEYNRFGSSIEAIIEDLNIDTHQSATVDIEIVKVIAKSNEQVCELYDSAIVEKPAYHGTYVKIKPHKSQKVRANSNTVEVARDSSSSKNDDYNEFYFSGSDLVYESAGNMVYETTEYTIVAKDIPLKMNNYNMLF